MEPAKRRHRMIPVRFVPGSGGIGAWASMTFCVIVTSPHRVMAASDIVATQATSVLLPHDLSPWSMFLNADLVVKAVMLGLALASVITWTVWLAKSVELLTAQRRLRRDFVAVGGAHRMDDAIAALRNSSGVGSALLRAAAEEWQQSADVLGDREGVKERIASRLERLEVAAGRGMTRGTGVLATIGATAPFVGLFGTVWGIMNSFIGIAQSHTTNLAVVAPGIAEALLATACGLVAAIPAVVIYNHFSRKVASFRALVGDTAAAVMRLVSRELSRGEEGLSPTEAKPAVSKPRVAA